MGNSIRLFSIRGIDIRMHITFPLILVWAAIQFGLLANRGLQGAAFGIVVTLLLFTIVILHELGHSIAARHYGVSVKQIVLLPIGGVAQLARIPEKPLQEFVIAIAGPLVNFGLAMVLTLGALLFGYGLNVGHLSAVLTGIASASLASIFGYVFVSNLFLGLFNLLPAFPMDGGRVLRALLATKLSYPRATSIAVAIGQGMAFLLGLYGFMGGGFFLILVAIFIFIAARQEGQLVQLRSVFDGLTVEQVFSRHAEVLHPDSTLENAIDLTLNSFQSDFPVCDNGRIVGLITQSALINALTRHDPATPIAQVMMTGIEPVDPSEALFKAQQRLMEAQVDALPVVQEGQFLGLITSRDLNEAYRLFSRQPELLDARKKPLSHIERLGEA
jgi:Zn-dependent protease/CBS domain-containing protein